MWVRRAVAVAALLAGASCTGEEVVDDCDEAYEAEEGEPCVDFGFCRWDLYLCSWTREARVAAQCRGGRLWVREFPPPECPDGGSADGAVPDSGLHDGGRQPSPRD